MCLAAENCIRILNIKLEAFGNTKPPPRQLIQQNAYNFPLSRGGKKFR